MMNYLKKYWIETVAGTLALLLIAVTVYGSIKNEKINQEILLMPPAVQKEIGHYREKIGYLNPNDIVKVTFKKTGNTEVYAVTKVLSSEVTLTSCLDGKQLTLPIEVRAGIEVTKDYSFEFIPIGDWRWKPRYEWYK